MIKSLDELEWAVFRDKHTATIKDCTVTILTVPRYQAIISRYNSSGFKYDIWNSDRYASKKHLQKELLKVLQRLTDTWP